MKKKILSLINLFILMPSFALAASLKDMDPSAQPDLPSFLKNIVIPYMMGLVGGTAVVFIMVGGIQYITSSGDKNRIDRAKKTLTYSILGLLFVLLSQVILGIIAGGQIFNVLK